MRPTSATGRRLGRNGFSLVEVMVALAIFALSAAALVQLERVSVRSAAAVETALLGRIVATNLLAEALTDVPAPAFGQSRGIIAMGGRLWRWQRAVVPLGEPRLLRIEVAVSAPTTPKMRSVTVRGVRLS